MTSKLIKVDKLKRLTEIKIGDDNFVSNLIIDGESVSDYEQTIGDFLIKSLSTTAVCSDNEPECNVSIGGYERMKIFAICEKHTVSSMNRS